MILKQLRLISSYNKLRNSYMNNITNSLKSDHSELLQYWRIFSLNWNQLSIYYTLKKTWFMHKYPQLPWVSVEIPEYLREN